MSAEQNKTIARRIVEDVFNRRDLNAMGELFSPDFIEHEAPPPGVPAGDPGALFNMLFEAFPDLHVTIEQLIAEGDKVVLHMTWTGTQEDAFMGKQASGKRMSISVIDIFRIVDSQCLEHWGGITDTAAMMQQLGGMSE